MVRIGVAGAGYWGPNLIRNCHELGYLTAVCDVNASVLDALRQQFPAVAYTQSFEDLLQAPTDAIVIATPANTHADLSLRALKAGKHVFVEKPMALNTADGAAMVDAADHAQRTLFVGHLLLYHPAIVKIKALLSSDTVGQLWHIRSRRVSLGKLRAHEDVWWSFAPHDVAVVLALMGTEPQFVTGARTRRPNTILSDGAYADYDFGNGRLAHVEVCWLDPDKSWRLDVFGTSGILTLTDSRQGSTLSLIRCGASTKRGEEFQVWRQPPEYIDLPQQEPMRAELLAFVDAIRSGGSSQTDGREGLAVLRAMEMADRASRLGVAKASAAVV